MEHTIKKIMSIDRDAENYRKNCELLLDARKKELEEQLVMLQKEYDLKISNMKKNIMGKELNEAEKAAALKKEECDRILELMKSRYEEAKEIIIEDVFSKLTASVKEAL